MSTPFVINPLKVLFPQASSFSQWMGRYKSIWMQHFQQEWQYTVSKSLERLWQMSSQSCPEILPTTSHRHPKGAREGVGRTDQSSLFSIGEICSFCKFAEMNLEDSVVYMGPVSETEWPRGLEFLLVHPLVYYWVSLSQPNKSKRMFTNIYVSIILSFHFTQSTRRAEDVFLILEKNISTSHPSL